MVGDDISHHKVVVNQIGLQTKCAKESTEAVEPSRRAAEHTIQHQDKRDGEWNVDHALYKQRESAVRHLFQIDTRAEGGQKNDQDHPDGCPFNFCLLTHHLAKVNTY